jgi:hypothetical protein
MLRVFGVGNLIEIICAQREEPYMQWFSAAYVKFRTVSQIHVLARSHVKATESMRPK